MHGDAGKKELRMSVRAAVGLLGELVERQAKPGGAAFHLNEPEVYALWAALGLRHGAFAYVAADGDLAAWAAGATRLADGEGRLVLKLVGRDRSARAETLARKPAIVVAPVTGIAFTAFWKATVSCAPTIAALTRATVAAARNERSIRRHLR